MIILWFFFIPIEITLSEEEFSIINITLIRLKQNILIFEEKRLCFLYMSPKFEYTGILARKPKFLYLFYSYQIKWL